MTISNKEIHRLAQNLGAPVCGISDLEMFKNEIPQRDPKFILPNAKTIIGFGFPVPKGLYYAMNEGLQVYGYTTLGVKFLDEQFAEIFLLKMARYIENAGYDACIQRSVPNLRIMGDKQTNPEVIDTYELVHSTAVSPEKPVPDIIIDVNKAAFACGIGQVGLSGHILNETYGPFIRYCFIITDAPIEYDNIIPKQLCDNCGLCTKACEGNAITEDGLDTWQCSVYYKGAGKSNPFMSQHFLKNNPNREEILNGKIKFDSKTARQIYKHLDFLPNTQSGYSPCLCKKACDFACYKHLKEVGAI